MGPTAETGEEPLLVGLCRKVTCTNSNTVFSGNAFTPVTAITQKRAFLVQWRMMIKKNSIESTAMHSNHARHLSLWQNASMAAPGKPSIAHCEDRQPWWGRRRSLQLCHRYVPTARLPHACVRSCPGSYHHRSLVVEEGTITQSLR
jgi:hypothetical protein